MTAVGGLLHSDNDHVSTDEESLSPYCTVNSVSGASVRPYLFFLVRIEQLLS